MSIYKWHGQNMKILYLYEALFFMIRSIVYNASVIFLIKLFTRYNNAQCAINTMGHGGPANNKKSKYCIFEEDFPSEVQKDKI